MKQSLSRPLQTALTDKLINSPGIKNFTLKVLGRSMWPFLAEADKVNCRKLSGNSKPRFGQIVVISGNDILIHRVIGMKHDESGWRVLTKGDFRLAADGWIPEDKVIAGVVGKDDSGEFNRAGEILIGVLSLAVYFLPSFLKNFLRTVKKSIV